MFLKLVTVAGILILLGCGGDTPQIENTASSRAIGTITDTQKDVITAHNEKRDIYFADSPLTYSIDLENAARVYANTLANNGKFEHDTQNNHAKNYGENLYASSENRPLSIYDAMPHWFDKEELHYHYDDGSCDAQFACGHYTQVIWQDTTEVGCAMAQYKRGNFKNGFVYVCKYYKAGNSSLNGKQEKPYCSNYDKSDIYTGAIPTTISLAGKKFPIELVVEDRVNCTRSDNRNGAIEFSNDLQTAKVKDFEIFNNGKYPNTLEFNSITKDGKTIIMRGTNDNIADEKYKGKNIFMKFTLLGQTADYYSVELEWNGLDEDKPLFNRDMKAKLYK
jgi:hypothetical protein